MTVIFGRLFNYFGFYGLFLSLVCSWVFGGFSLVFLAVCSSLMCYEDFIARHSGHVHIVPTAKISCVLLELDDLLVHFRMMHNNLTRKDDCGKKESRILN